MKILYHHRTASKDGQNVHIEEIVAALRRLGHQVLVVEPPFAGRTAFGEDGGWVAGLKRRLPRALYEVLELGYSIPAYRRLKQAYDNFKPDVLYERANLYFLPGLWLKRRTGIPMLLEVNAPLAEERATHGGLALPALARRTERAVWRGADAVLPVTGVLAETLRRTGVAPERIEVIANGIDPKRFHPRVDGGPLKRELGLENKLVLGFTGFVRPWHGLDRVLDAMAALPERQRLHLLMVGDGPARPALEAQAQRLGLSAQLTCLHVVARERVPACVAAFDIALQPRVVDYASPLKLFEYMAVGRAILAPDQPNIREVLTDGFDALLFPPEDEIGFRAALARLCADEGLRRRLGATAAASLEARGFTWDANARRIAAAALRLLAPVVKEAA